MALTSISASHLDILDKGADLAKALMEIYLALYAARGTSHTSVEFHESVTKSPKLADLASKNRFVKTKLGEIVESVYSKFSSTR